MKRVCFDVQRMVSTDSESIDVIVSDYIGRQPVSDVYESECRKVVRMVTVVSKVFFFFETGGFYALSASHLLRARVYLGVCVYICVLKRLEAMRVVL